MIKPGVMGGRPHEVPAPLTTQVNLTITDHGWRLTFGEPLNEHEVQYHSAVFLPTSTAHELTNLMLSSMQKQKN